jgi:hypothetical protein
MDWADAERSVGFDALCGRCRLPVVQELGLLDATKLNRQRGGRVGERLVLGLSQSERHTRLRAEE